MFTIRTILHPTDFSDSSAAAFRLACSLARERGAQLLVLHVYPPPIAHGEVVARRQDNGYHRLLWDQLHAFRPEDPAVGVDYWLREGEPAAEILKLAQEEGADLIVLGTHGRTGLGRILLGSVAEQVVRRAACPVLTVKMPHGEASAPAAPTAEVPGQPATP
jgi:nucleotide-binding universal stress UspA family protein